jgi:hypothetical protein
MGLDPEWMFIYPFLTKFETAEIGLLFRSKKLRGITIKNGLGSPLRRRISTTGVKAAHLPLDHSVDTEI